MSQGATAEVVTLGRAPGGSAILTQWRAQQERQRAEQRAAREQAQAMAALRRSGRLVARGTPQAGPTAQQAAPAFPVVGGQRAFESAATDRLSAGWSVFNTGINADLEAALSTLRARSRGWTMNTDQGARYLELVADNIVGSDPPRLQVRAKLRDGSEAMDEVANTAVERAWARWCARGQCEVTGELSFGEVCRAVVQGAARDGEYLARRIRDRRLDFGFQVQLLDVDRIDTGLNVAPAVRGGNAIRLGIEVNAYGRKIAAHLFNRHPGDSGAGLAPSALSERVLMDDLLHGFVLKRPEQVRGYPWASAVLRRSDTLFQYERYALDAAKYGASKMGFYTVDKDSVQQTEETWEAMKDATGELVQEVEAGMLEALPPGVGFESFDPKYPVESFATFVGEYKRDIAAGLNVAHHNLSGNMSGVNYSSARIAELAERRSWRALQRWLIASFVQPVFEEWLRLALLNRAITLPSGAALPADRFEKFAEAASFQPPGWAWVDPEADIKAAAIAVSYDMRSMRQITDEQGVDLEDTLADKARLRDRYTALNLPVPGWLSGAGAVSATGGAQPQPAAPNTEKPAA